MAWPPASPWRERLEASLQRVWARPGGASLSLLPLASIFNAVTTLRRGLYRLGLLETGRLPVPVIVVGNLVAGGAGKTPAVLAIVALLQAAGYTPGIVSRGYGRRGDGIALVEVESDAALVGDEPLLLRRRAGVPVAVGQDRVAAGHRLLQAHADVDVVVGDDGLQHIGLERDVEVLVFDERGVGNGRLLPAGPLRERLPDHPAERRLVLYNADAPTTPLPGFIGRRSLAGAVALDAWWRGEPPTSAALTALRGRSVVAVAGLARPGRFFAMLRQAGLDIAEQPLADHYDYAMLPWPPNAADVILTEKDAVKMPPARRLGTRVWVAALDFEPEPAFGAALLALIGPPGPSPSSEQPSSPPSSSFDAHGNPLA